MKSVSFGDEKVQKWLTSLVVSILASVLLTQPLQVALLAFFFVTVFKSSDENENISSLGFDKHNKKVIFFFSIILSLF